MPLLPREVRRAAWIYDGVSAGFQRPRGSLGRRVFSLVVSVANSLLRGPWKAQDPVRRACAAYDVAIVAGVRGKIPRKPEACDCRSQHSPSIHLGRGNVDGSRYTARW